MKIWRIAILGGIVAVILVAIFFGYKIIETGRLPKSSGSESSLFEFLVMFGSLEVLIFLFVVALISFPCFWFKSLPWFLIVPGMVREGKDYYKRLNKFDFISLLVSSLIIFAVVNLGHYLEAFT